jgi:hypothetical protein
MWSIEFNQITFSVHISTMASFKYNLTLMGFMTTQYRSELSFQQLSVHSIILHKI